MIPKLPDEYKGKTNKNGGYTQSNPRAWTEKEIEWISSLKAKGYTNKEIAGSVDRTVNSVAIKLKRISKTDNTYNASHVTEKYSINLNFIKEVKPKTVLDCYTGDKNFYSNYLTEGLTTNDINTDIAADYHLDAHKLLCKLYYEGCKFDVIDLDPYGSAYDCFDLAIKMSKKGLVITLGELGHKRWKRLDFVSRYYNIDSLEDFTIENLIEHIQMIGHRNKKTLTVFEYREWKNIGRVWFKVEPLKITEQWEVSSLCYTL